MKYIIIGFFVVFSVVFFDIKTASAQSTFSNCYTYAPSSTHYNPGPTIPLQLTLGGLLNKTIQIANQNPPSILQKMYWVPSSSTCALWYWFVHGYTNRNISANFNTSTGSIPIYGSPFQFTSANPIIEYGPPYGEPTGFLYDFLSYINYLGLSDFGQGEDTVENVIAKEDAVINNIASTGRFGVRYGGALNSNWTGGSYYADVSVPATNCVKLYGNGPKKIVFMRASSYGATVSDYIYNVDEIIETLKTIDPYKEYKDRFSFYVDLRKYDDSAFPRIGNFFDLNPGANSIPSSCLNNVSETDVFLFKNATMSEAWTLLYGKTIFMNVEKTLTSNNTGRVLAHELAHALGGVYDEYVVGTTGDIDLPMSRWNTNASILPKTNCATYPSWNYRGLDNLTYGSYTERGCTYINGGEIKTPTNYYRPSPVSIMNRQANQYEFNVVSCGYVIAGILRTTTQPINKSDAANHWPECMRLGTIKDGIPPSTLAAYVNGVIPVAGTIKTYKVSGSGFTPTGNTIRLTRTPSGKGPSSSWFASLLSSKIAIAQTVSSYEIHDATSTANGSEMIFSIPEYIPDGVYTVSVGALNSPWTVTSYMITVTGNGSNPPPPPYDEDNISTVPPTTPPPTTPPVDPPPTSSPFTISWDPSDYGQPGPVGKKNYWNPRITLNDTTYVPYHSGDTATKWCKSVSGQTYDTGTSIIYQANPQSGERLNWNTFRSDWEVIPAGLNDYPRVYQCSTVGTPTTPPPTTPPPTGQPTIDTSTGTIPIGTTPLPTSTSYCYFTYPGSTCATPGSATPPFSLVSFPTNGTAIFSLNTSALRSVTNATLYIDDVAVETVNSSPWTLSATGSRFAVGNHNVYAVVSGIPVSASISASVRQYSTNRLTISVANSTSTQTTQTPPPTNSSTNQLTVNATGAVFGDNLYCNGTPCNYKYSYPAGTTVVVTASPRSGYTYSYSDACTGNGSCSIVMNSPKTLNVNFASIATPPTTYELTVNAIGAVFGDNMYCNGTPCDYKHQYPAGTTVTVTTIPRTGYTYTYSGACTGTTTCSIVMDAPKTLNATFSSTLGASIWEAFLKLIQSFKAN